MADADFDVVVAGGGSAGCVLAGRLAQAGARVCLVEAGPDYGPHAAGKWPPELLDARQGPRTHDWGYDEVERARVMGGCSAHNECAAVWGQPADYDGWATLGNPGWSHADLQPAMRQIERALAVRPCRDDELAAWARAFARSARVGGVTANVKDSVRWNAAFAFLDPARGQRSLTIKADTLVDGLVIEKGRVLSLVCRRRGAVSEVRASRYVLAAGSIGSPLILMRSGVGAPKDLKPYRIPVAVDLIGVGRNLHDHPGIGLSFEPSPAAGRALVDDLVKQRFHESQVIMPARSRHAKTAADLHLLPYQSLSGFDATFVILAFNLAPHSRGQVRLGGRDARRRPRIELGFLTDPQNRDLDVLLDGLARARDLARRAPLAASIQKESEPGARVQSETSLRAYIRDNVEGYSHPVGTCKMGPDQDPMAVVNADGRVRGLDNLYVADASIMPVIPRANTNLSAMLVGWRVAEHLASPRP